MVDNKLDEYITIFLFLLLIFGYKLFKFCFDDLII